MQLLPSSFLWFNLYLSYAKNDPDDPSEVSSEGQ